MTVAVSTASSPAKRGWHFSSVFPLPDVRRSIFWFRPVLFAVQFPVLFGPILLNPINNTTQLREVIKEYFARRRRRWAFRERCGWGHVSAEEVPRSNAASTRRVCRGDRISAAGETSLSFGRHGLVVKALIQRKCAGSSQTADFTADHHELSAAIRKYRCTCRSEKGAASTG